MPQEVKGLDLVFAGKLAIMIAAAGDIEIRGPIMTVPIRELGGSLVSFDLDIRGLAADVSETEADAVVAMGNDRGGQHAALALIANGVMDDHPDWDFSADDGEDPDDTDGDFESIQIDIEGFMWRGPREEPAVGGAQSASKSKGSEIGSPAVASARRRNPFVM